MKQNKISAWQKTPIWYVNDTLRISHLPLQEVPIKREQMVFTRKITINHLHLHCSQLVDVGSIKSVFSKGKRINDQP